MIVSVRWQSLVMKFLSGGVPMAQWGSVKPARWLSMAWSRASANSSLLKNSASGVKIFHIVEILLDLSLGEVDSLVYLDARHVNSPSLLTGRSPSRDRASCEPHRFHYFAHILIDDPGRRLPSTQASPSNPGRWFYRLI